MPSVWDASRSESRGEETTRQSLGTLRDDLIDIQQRLDDAERSAAQLPHREKYLRLVIGFMRQFLDLHEQLIDDVDRELTATPPKRARRSA